MAAAPAAAAGRLALTRTTQTLRPPQRTQLLLRRPLTSAQVAAYPSLLLHGQQRAGRGGDRRHLRHCLFLKRLPSGAGVSCAPALAHCTIRLTRISARQPLPCLTPPASPITSGAWRPPLRPTTGLLPPTALPPRCDWTSPALSRSRPAFAWPSLSTPRPVCCSSPPPLRPSPLLCRRRRSCRPARRRQPHRPRRSHHPRPSWDSWTLTASWRCSWSPRRAPGRPSWPVQFGMVKTGGPLPGAGRASGRAWSQMMQAPPWPGSAPLSATPSLTSHLRAVPRLAHGVGTRRCVSRGARVRQPGSSSPRAPQRESAACHGRTSPTKIMLAQWPNRFFTRAQIIVGRGFAPVRSRSRVPAAIWGQRCVNRNAVPI